MAAFHNDNRFMPEHMGRAECWEVGNTLGIWILDIRWSLDIGHWTFPEGSPKSRGAIFPVHLSRDPADMKADEGKKMPVLRRVLYRGETRGQALPGL